MKDVLQPASGVCVAKKWRVYVRLLKQWHEDVEGVWACTAWSCTILELCMLEEDVFGNDFCSQWMDDHPDDQLLSWRAPDQKPPRETAIAEVTWNQ